VLAQVPRELREIADALETRAPVSPMPAIPRSPHPPRLVAARGTGSADPTTRSPFEPSGVRTHAMYLFRALPCYCPALRPDAAQRSNDQPCLHEPQSVREVGVTGLAIAIEYF
jgi:hypothetical protein